MMARCFNPNAKRYRDYGHRGINVCDRWLRFENFYADMGDPQPGKSLDRINNNGSYGPGNCKWSTPIEQARNQRPRKRKRQRSTVAELQAYSASLERAAS
jgi:hypothetical protein